MPYQDPWPGGEEEEAKMVTYFLKTNPEGCSNIRGSNCRLDIRRIFFSQRVVNTGNSLLDSLKGVGG